MTRTCNGLLGVAPLLALLLAPAPLSAGQAPDGEPVTFTKDIARSCRRAARAAIAPTRWRRCR